MPNRRADGRVDLRAWVDEDFFNMVKIMAEKEGMNKNEWIQKCIENYVKEQKQSGSSPRPPRAGKSNRAGGEA